MPGKRVLVLGGTGEARALAALLIAAGFDPVTSLAGVTSSPRLPVGQLRQGGFGGVDGMVAYLAAEHIAAIVDATHPFAAQISRHGHEAAARVQIPYLRLERPAWVSEPGDLWIPVSTIAEAVDALPAGARVLVTIGRKEVGPFFNRANLNGVARMIEPPALDVPAGWSVILERPPFTIESEVALIERIAATQLVTKNAGGDETRAKLIAAREKKIPVIMVQRPAKPSAPAFQRGEDLVPALCRLLSP